MRISVDRGMCQGHVLCAATAPDLYTLDDDGYSNVDAVEVPTGMEHLARRGMEACPERAITVTE